MFCEKKRRDCKLKSANCKLQNEEGEWAATLRVSPAPLEGEGLGAGGRWRVSETPLRLMVIRLTARGRTLWSMPQPPHTRPENSLGGGKGEIGARGLGREGGGV